MGVILAGTRDGKITRWSTHWHEDGFDVALGQSTMQQLRSALRHVVRPRGAGRCWIVIRYLNDDPSRLRTGLAALRIVTLVSLRLLPRVGVVWICHNVDRETHEHHPHITTALRWIVALFASTVVVTDPLLVSPARNLLPRPARGKLSWTCFGAEETYGSHKSWGTKTKPAVYDAIADFSRDARSASAAAGRPTLIGLSVSLPRPKMRHFDHAGDLIDAASAAGIDLRLVIAANHERLATFFGDETLHRFRTDDRILYFDHAVSVNEADLRDHIDFIWRGHDDWSTPITAYVAAANGIPLLAIDWGFLPSLVNEGELGATVRPDFADVDTALRRIHDWEPADATRQFLASRTWDAGARAILDGAGASLIRGHRRPTDSRDTR